MLETLGQKTEKCLVVVVCSNDPILTLSQGATEKGEGGGEDTFEKTRKEKLDAVEAAERKFAKVRMRRGEGRGFFKFVLE